MIHGMTRRQLLRTECAGTLVMGGAALTSCSKHKASDGAASVVLAVAGGMAGFDPMPTAKAQHADPSTKAYVMPTGGRTRSCR